MRDVSTKFHSLRSAKASAVLTVRPSTVKAIKSGKVPKVDPVGVARIAGIQAAKNTSLIIPYCHQIPLDFVDVEISLNKSSITVDSEVKAIWKTGVEMEALVAASSAALTLYDMLKPVDESMEVSSIRLVEKRGGKSSIKNSGSGMNAAVLVMSDSVSAGKKKDSSGALLVKRLKALNLKIVAFKVLPDDQLAIERTMKSIIATRHVDLIVTTGGTGIGPRDITPEATLNIIDRRLRGVEEALRSYGQDRTPMSMMSRGVVGVRGKAIIVNLPGSRGGVEDGMNAIFPAILHAFKMIRGGGH